MTRPIKTNIIMKNRILILTSFFLIFGMIGCTKFGKNITVNGRVLNPITNEPISDITVRLIKSKNLQYYGGYKTIKETTSDINGNFELSAGRTGGIWIVADFNYQNYYELGWDYNEKYHSQLKVDKGEIMHVDYHLVPYGEYRLIINNINCGGPNDTIIINKTNFVQSFLDNDWMLTGCDGYTTSWNKVPMGNIHTKYTVIRNNISNTYQVNFMVHPNQNNEQVINY